MQCTVLHAQYSEDIAFENNSEIYCGSSALEKKIFDLDQRIENKSIELEKELYEQILANAKSRTSNIIYVVPVVVHLIHRDQESLDKIPDSKIQKLIESVNTVFRNAGRGDVYIDSKIEFCLEFINRQVSDRHFFISTRQDDVDMKLKYGWDQNEVLNLYLPSGVSACWINDRCPGAYATLPGSHGNYFDGVTMSAPTGGSSNILVHELGHIFGLYHIWEGGCLNTNCFTQGDKVCDTPPQGDNTSCNQSVNSCSSDMHSHTGFTEDQLDLTFNSMGSCTRGGFTQGQIDRMRYFIQTVRNTYFQNNYCGGTCPDPMDVWYTTNIDEVDAGVISIGDTVFFTNQSNQATEYEWYINDSLVSVAQDFSYVFDSIGNFKVTLKGENWYPLCSETYSEIVNVFCLTFAGFQVDKLVAKVDSPFYFTNYSEHAKEYEWFVNGELYSTNENITYTHTDTVSEPTRIEICLRAISNDCEFTDCQEIVILHDLSDEDDDCGLCLEECDNLLDDDRDGLVDIFDSDCECSDSYYNNCQQQCQLTIPVDRITVIPNWEVEDIFGQGQIIAIDVDGDRLSEIITKSLSKEQILVFDPVKKSLEYEIDILLDPGLGSIAGGDTDKDGYSEIFVIGLDGYLHRFDFINAMSGFEYTWKSSKTIDRKTRPFGSGVTLATNYMQYTPAIADFDADDNPEIYVGAQVFRSTDGQLISDPNPDDNINQGIAEYGGICSPTAAALDNSRKLDLIAGSSVFEYKYDYVNEHFTVGKNPKSIEIDGQTIDGVTRTLDFNNDGKLDVLVVANDKIFIYDPTTMQLLGDVYENNSTLSYHLKKFSLPVVCDIDNDGWLEIIICNRTHLMILDDYRTNGSYEWGQADKTIVVQNKINFNSGSSTPTVFDFNGDGKKEIVISGFLNSYIYDDDLSLLKKFPCNSASMAAPVVADLDGDNEAELCMVCFKTLTVFESYGINWSSARPVWNQLNYHITNINDDGSIPIQKQNHHVLNDSISHLGALVQTPILNQDNKVLINHGDISLEILESNCINNQVSIKIRLCNDFDFELTENIYISVYADDPISKKANLITKFQLGNENFEDGCIVHSNSYGAIFNKDIYFVANDQGTIESPFDFVNSFPKIKYLECDYYNNIDHVRINRGVSQPLDLGEDKLICGTNMYTINAGSGYDNYLWQDGSHDSILLVTTPGWYSLEAWNSCESEFYQDSVYINLVDTIYIDEAYNRQVCEGQSVKIDMPYFDSYLWSTKDQIICDTCSTLDIIPTENATYYFEGISYPGCVTLDSMIIEVVDQIKEEVFITSNLCFGDSITYEGISIGLGSNHRFVLESSYGCDSIVDVFAIAEAYEMVEEYPKETLRICQGDSLGLKATTGDFIRFEWSTAENVLCTDCVSIDVSPDTSTIFEVQMFLGWTNSCKVYTQEFEVIVVNDIYEQIEIASCNGTDFLYENQVLQIDSNYIFNYKTDIGCDSTVEVSGVVKWFEIDTFACEGQSINFNGQDIVSGSYEEVFYTNSEGCHLARVNVTSLPSFAQSIDTFVCGDQTIDFDGFELLGNTEETIFYSSEFGCDSVLKISVHQLEQYYIDLDTFICDSDEVLFQNTLIPIGESREFYFETIDGCDSVINLNVIGLPIFQYTLDTFACSGSSIKFDTIEVFAGTTEMVAYSSASGCDSVFFINVVSNDDLASYEYIDTFVCEGELLNLNDTLLGPEDFYSEKWLNQYGCDSIVEYYVNELNKSFTLIDTAICEGSILLFNGAQLSPNQEAEFNFSNSENCDSLVVIRVAELASDFNLIDTFICEGGAFEINGETIGVGDEIQINYSNLNLCDSIVSYRVFGFDNYEATIDTSICEGGTIEILGYEFVANESRQIILESNDGCDSIFNVTVTGLDVLETQIDTSICEGDILEILNMQITEEGTYNDVQVGWQGCDSLVTINVSINPLPQGLLKIGSSCYTVGSAYAEVVDVFGAAPFHFAWSNGAIDTNKIENLVSGIYELTITDKLGCESTTQIVFDEFASYQPFGMTEDASCEFGTLGSFTIDSSFGALFFSLDGINFQSELVFENLETGYYEMFYKDAKACQSSFNFEIQTEPSIIVELQEDTIITEGERLVLTHQTFQGIPTEYNWYPSDGLSCTSCPSPTAQPDFDMLYILEVIDANGCRGMDSVWVRIDQQTEIYIPNSFAPESINENHRFTVFSGDTNQMIISMEIYDTWGNLVFKNENFKCNDLDQGWDGTFRSKGLAPAVFVYIIELGLQDGSTKRHFGDLTLVR